MAPAPHRLVVLADGAAHTARAQLPSQQRRALGSVPGTPVAVATLDDALAFLRTVEGKHAQCPPEAFMDDGRSRMLWAYSRSLGHLGKF